MSPSQFGRAGHNVSHNGESNVLPRRGAKLLSLHSHVSARAWNCRVQSLVTRKFLKNEGTFPKSWSLENRVLAETDCDQCRLRTLKAEWAGGSGSTSQLLQQP